jgi:hypothetical protein
MPSDLRDQGNKTGRLAWKSIFDWLAILRSDRSVRALRLSRTAGYWHIRARLGKFAFYLRRYIWGTRRALAGSRRSASLSGAILSASAATIAAAVVTVSLTEALQLLIQHAGGDPATHLPMWLLESIDRQLEPTTLVQLYGTLAQVAGVFLGLYFAALSVVVSTGYARMPSSIRDLFARDFIGNWYIRLVAVLGTVSLIDLLLMAGKWNVGMLNLIASIVLAGLSVASFFPLGLRLMALFDPHRLAHDCVVPDLVLQMESASKGGVHRRDPSFQAHYHRVARAAARTYSDIVDIACGEPGLRAASLVSLAQEAAVLLSVYTSKKGTIPLDSEWFPNVQRTKSWFEAADSELNIAMMTGTGPGPATARDHFWSERWCSRLFTRVSATLLGESDFQNTTNALAAVQHALADIAEKLRIPEALLIFGDLRALIEPHMRDFDEANYRETTPSENFSLAIVDYYGMTFTGIVIGVAKGTAAFKAEQVATLAANVDFGTDRIAYPIMNTAEVGVRLAELEKKVRFEVAAEGRRVSPEWYLAELIADAIQEALFRIATELVDGYDTFFATIATNMVAAGKPIAAAQIVERGLEIYAKLRRCLPDLQNANSAVAPYRKGPTLPAPPVDWAGLEARARATRERLLLCYARTIADLPMSGQVESLPDYFGHAYWTLSEGCHSALIDSRSELFGQLCGPFFAAALRASDAFRQKVLETPLSQQALADYVGVFLDLMELSGTAYVVGHVVGNDAWQRVTRVWDVLTAAAPDAKGYLSMLAATLENLTGVLVPTRESERLGWRRRLRDFLIERGLIEPDPWTGQYSEPPPAAAAADPLVAAFAEEPHGKAAAVFVVAYVAANPLMHDVPLTGEAAWLARAAGRARRADDEE